MWIWNLSRTLLLFGCCSYALGEWSNWNDWSSCSVTCGAGIRDRARQCLAVLDGNVSCIGDDSEIMDCNVTECPAAGNVVIGVVVGGILCLLIIVAIIMTRHGRCWKGTRRFHPNESNDKIIQEADEDTVDAKLEYQNETHFEPSFITEVATDTGEKFVYVDPTQVYYKQKSVTFNEEVTIENKANINEDDVTSLPLEHHNGEIVNNPIFEDQADIDDHLVRNGVQNGLFKQHPRLKTFMDNPGFVEEDVKEHELEKYLVQDDKETESEHNSSLAEDIPHELEHYSMQDVNHIENVVHQNDDNIANGFHNANDKLDDTDQDNIKEENESFFLDPFDALDIIQRASPYLFGDQGDIVVTEIPVIDEIIMEDIVEVDDETYNDSETDSEDNSEGDSENTDDETETESNSEYQGSEDTVHYSENDSTDGANSVVGFDCDTDNNDA